MWPTGNRASQVARDSVIGSRYLEAASPSAVAAGAAPSMSTYRLHKLFAPGSVAMIGASPREKSLGRIVLRNMRDGGFAGPIHLVNPDFAEIDGLRAVPTLADLAAAPDVAIVATPAEAVPTVVAQAAEVGCAAAVIISTGLGHGPGSIAA